MDPLCSAPQVYRVGQRCLERRLHESQSEGNAPSDSGRARSGRDSGGGSTRSQVRIGLVHSLVQSGRAHRSGKSQSANAQPTPRTNTEPTSACDAMRRIGQWNTAWDPFFELDPVFTDEFMAMGYLRRLEAHATTPVSVAESQ